MKLKWHFASWETSLKTNFFQAIALAISIGMNLWLLQMALEKQHNIDVTITPAVIEDKLVIGKTSANENYLNSFGMYVATLMGNITVTNAPFVADTLSLFIDSSVYPQIRKTILAAANTRAFKEAAGATKYESTSILYEAKTNKVFVMGTVAVLTSIGGSPPQAITYEMELRIVDRKPTIFALEAYDGNTPHTLEWLKDHPQQTTQDKEN